MGWLERRRAARDAREAALLEAARAAKVAEAARDAREYHEALQAAALADGESTVPGVVLQRGEVAYLTITGAAFVEPKRAPGQWQGRSQGTSIRIAKGVSYRIGGSRGTYQQGEERPTPTDEGLFVVTDRRCIFIGTKRTTEWAFNKLVGYSTDGPGTAFFNVTNRQKTTGVLFGTEIEHRVDATIAAAIARHTSDEAHTELLAAMRSEYEHVYATWKALDEGREPPQRQGRELPTPAPSATPVEASATSGRLALSSDAIRAALVAANFNPVSDESEGFAIKPDGRRFKVMWVKSDGAGREGWVPDMAAALRDVGYSARVAREAGYPYVSVTQSPP